MGLVPHAAANMKYRPDITGLRAIAVLSVVGFHAFPARLPGGFIGVDIFFVISGYLISTIILGNLDRGAFSFVDFYARRIRRIFPALLLVLAACYAFGWFTLLADEYGQLGKHITAGAGFVSNLVLWSESGYFDNASDTKPLLHLWSLGVEEQFYIVWPLLLSCLAAGRRYRSLAALLAGIAVSFALNIWAAGGDPVGDFFAPQTRFWELLCGGLLAWAALYGAKGAEPGAVRVADHAASLAGFGLLAFGFLEINAGSRFPGWWAWVPVLGTVLVIAAGSRAVLNRLVLCNPVAIWIGLISYPLYLWHWPLLSYARILEGEFLGRDLKLVLVAAAILLAWATYRLVERPIQSGGKLGNRAAVLFSLMVLAGAAGFASYRLDGLAGRDVVAANPAIARHGYDGGDGGYLSDACGLGFQESRLFAVCGQDRRGNVRYALLGDSKAQALYTGLVRTSGDAGRWLVIGGNGPNGAPIPLISPEPEFADFQRQAGIAIDAIARDKDIDTVVLATAIRSIFRLSDGLKNGMVENYDYRYLQGLAASPLYDKAYAGLSRTISRFAAAGKKVVILADNPALPEARYCVARVTASARLDRLLGLGQQQLNPDCHVPLQAFDTETALYRKLLAALQQAFPGELSVFDAADIYCDRQLGVCGPSRDGRMLYAYTDHISDYASGLVGQALNDYLAGKAAAD